MFSRQTGWKLVSCLLVSDWVLMFFDAEFWVCGVDFALFWLLEFDGSIEGILVVVIVPGELFLEYVLSV